MKYFLIVFFISTASFAQPNKDVRPVEDKTVTPEGEKPKTNIFIPQELKQKDALEKEDNINLLRHQPFYFAYGHPTSKIQVSFKYRVINDTPLYFGYSQIMFWNLGEDSRPFKDSTYNPEVIYTYDIKRKIFLDNIDFGIWEHNSNGKAGITSRSFERNYVRLNFAREFKDLVLKFSTKLGYIHNLDKTNEDIRNYISPLELKLSLIGVFKNWAMDRSSFDIRYFPGGDHAQNWGSGGYELSTSFRFGGFSIVPAFYMQYFHGYAESLINYNQKVDEFRAGFIF
jgi:phospholipase A1